MNDSSNTPTRNKTLRILPSERENLCKLLSDKLPDIAAQDYDKVINADVLPLLPAIPSESFPLIIVDPPYNNYKTYGKTRFSKQNNALYMQWCEQWLSQMYRILQTNGSIYICCDVFSSPLIYNIASKYFFVKNRISWEREKGRGSKHNWKNCTEDIWFFTKSKDYVFNAEDVKIERIVVAPYKKNKQPKDWLLKPHGNVRKTYHSNFWSDVTIPFWSMPENTSHPTQKPEKLIAKLILASSNPKDLVFEPFSGSGTASVVAKKLGRHFIAVEQEKEYCLFALKRLLQADKDKSIQGFDGEVFKERNTFILQQQQLKNK